MLAAFGLLQDSAAVIIGAMLIAPLITPIIGAGLALTQGNRPLFQSVPQLQLRWFRQSQPAGLQIAFRAWALEDQQGIPVVGPLLLAAINVLTIMIGSSWVL
jgi:hypothetical protein